MSDKQNLALARFENNLVIGVLSVQLRIAIAKRPEEGCVMSHMELHFAVRLLFTGIALIYVLGPILWHWRVA